jgi:hypothetical protein
MNDFRQVRRYYQCDCAPWRDQGERTVRGWFTGLRHCHHPIDPDLVSLLVATGGRPAPVSGTTAARRKPAVKAMCVRFPEGPAASPLTVDMAPSGLKGGA